jgi:hypothetical protein
LSKILVNPGGSDIFIADTGVLVTSASSYTIPPQDYAVFAASSDVIVALSNVSLILNDGSNDITSISNAVDIIKGWCPPQAVQEFFFDFLDVVSGSSPVVLLTNSLAQEFSLNRLEVSCRAEASFEVQVEGVPYAMLTTGAGRPHANFVWYPARPVIANALVEVIITKRANSPDMRVGAFLMGSR